MSLTILVESHCLLTSMVTSSVRRLNLELIWPITSVQSLLPSLTSWEQRWSTSPVKLLTRLPDSLRTLEKNLEDHENTWN